jgi:hypothetical protein
MKKFLAQIIAGLVVFIVHFPTFGSRTASDSIQLVPENEDWHVLLEEMAENGINTDEWEETLAELAINPVQLNNASREALENIPLLNAEQVENLSYYLYRYGPMVNLSELLLVEGMDARTMRWLKPFVCLGSTKESPVNYPPMKKALLYGKKDLRWSLGSTLQKKQGYNSEPDSAEHYLGDPLHACFRYGFDYKDQLQWGVVLEKDPGERWWNSNKYSVDFVSFHFLVKDTKRMNTFIFGDYKVHFGQGLVCGSAFSLGKNTSGCTPELSGPLISRHFSASEINFYRGVATRLTIKPYYMEHGHRFGIDLSTFISIKKLDSNVKNGLFSSILNTGLHRTIVEAENQEKLNQTVVGNHLQFRWTNLTIGFTSLAWLFDASAEVSSESWKRYNLRGNKGGNLSADFRTAWKGLLLFGEMAIDQNGSSALLIGASFKPHTRMNVSILGRKYAPQYQSLFSNAFSEGSSTKNEEGLYMSTDFQFAKRVRLTGYLDVFRFPWLSYAVSTPSWGQDLAAELNMTVGRNGLIKLLVKSKLKEKNRSMENLPTLPIQSSLKNQVRLQVSQKQGLWTMKSVLYANMYRFSGDISTGYAVAQDFGYDPPGNKFSMVLHTVLFNTDAWENKIYLWEKDLPGAFSMPMLYGRGSRTAIFARYNVKNLSLLIKIADSVQPGLNVLGVGSEQLQGNRKTEVRFQLSWNF